MEIKIIRGYRLKLWKDRLNLSPDFFNNLDLTALNYVHLEHREKNEITVILLTKMRGSRTPIPALIKMSPETLEAISERIVIDETIKVENSSNRSKGKDKL